MESASESQGRILVIDDEESMRHALVRGLERAGFRCTAVATGKEGVERFHEGGFDAVLTDVRLPDLSGLDVLAVLTEVDPAVPVVVMTGYGTMDTALEAMRRGARDYVGKPFVVKDVVRTLQSAISDRNDTRDARRLRALVERRTAPEGFRAVEAELQERMPPRGPGEGDRPPPGRAAIAAVLGEHADGTPLSLRDALHRFETAYVRDLLIRTGGNVAAAARLAGIARPNFHKKLRALDIDADLFKQAARRGRLREM